VTDSSLKERITEDMKQAMRAKDKPRLGVIRLIQSEIKRVEVDERIELDDTRVLSILDKMLKQRKDSASQYRDADRIDLAEQEEYEISVLQEYLPAQLDDKEIEAIVDAAVAETGASSMQDMGKVMGLVKPRVQGRGDMGAVSQLVKARLS
jgi:uncharacterized protein YqeY